MMQRCLNPKKRGYKDYGGRGIQVSPVFVQSFKAFLDEVGPRPSPKHSVDRINTSKGYEPGNVRWATGVEQARNRRGLRMITYKGETRCVSEWAELHGLHKARLEQRLKAGWDIHSALTIPVGLVKGRGKGRYEQYTPTFT